MRTKILPTQNTLPTVLINLLNLLLRNYSRKISTFLLAFPLYQMKNNNGLFILHSVVFKPHYFYIWWTRCTLKWLYYHAHSHMQQCRMTYREKKFSHMDQDVGQWSYNTIGFVQELLKRMGLQLMQWPKIQWYGFIFQVCHRTLL